MENKLLYDFFVPYWSAETSYTPHLWSSQNVSLGQCVPTALIIQDYLGGELVKGKIHLKNNTVETHYWNYLENKKLDIDATHFQYDDNIQDIVPATANPLREHVLEDPDTKRRYDLLKNMIDNENTKEFFESLRFNL